MYCRHRNRGCIRTTYLLLKITMSCFGRLISQLLTNEGVELTNFLLLKLCIISLELPLIYIDTSYDCVTRKMNKSIYTTYCHTIKRTHSQALIDCLKVSVPPASQKRKFKMLPNHTTLTEVMKKNLHMY